MLDDIETSNKQIVFGGDFNLIFDYKLETNAGNPVLKKEASNKINRNKWKSESMWYLENTNPKKNITHFIKTRFVFRFKHTARFCQESRSFCIFLHWPFTKFFLIWKRKWFCSWKRIRSLISSWSQIVSILKVWKKTFGKRYAY